MELTKYLIVQFTYMKDWEHQNNNYTKEPLDI